MAGGTGRQRGIHRIAVGDAVGLYSDWHESANLAESSLGSGVAEYCGGVAEPARGGGSAARGGGSAAWATAQGATGKAGAGIRGGRAFGDRCGSCRDRSGAWGCAGVYGPGFSPVCGGAVGESFECEAGFSERRRAEAPAARAGSVRGRATGGTACRTFGDSEFRFLILLGCSVYAGAPRSGRFSRGTSVLCIPG